MINQEKFQQVLTAYKAYIPVHWSDEVYKWKALAHFQKYWNIHANSFKDMFQKATEKTKNLLNSDYVYPKATLLLYANEDDEAVRQMFAVLFDESRNLQERIEHFRSEADRLRQLYDKNPRHTHYQDLRAISTYLWLMYPDKYYIYRYQYYASVADALGTDYTIKANGKIDNLFEGFRMYDELSAALRQDKELTALLQERLTGDCYPDPKFHTVAIDFGYFVSKFYHESAENEGWYPQDYDPQLRVEDWRSLLKDPEVFTKSSLEIMYRMLHFGGQATCKQLSLLYGESWNFYNSGSAYLAQRIAKKTGCPVMRREDSNNAKWWPILYVGKHAEDGMDGTFIWRLRNELREALEQYDFSSVNLYAEPPKAAPDGNQPEAYTDEMFLKEVYLSPPRYQELKHLLMRKKNVILQGAPGVGKTFAAKRLAYAIMGKKDDSRIKMVQFHQNYSYEDFIMGYRPQNDGFQLTEGIFYQFCKTAEADRQNDYFFIIDEINRGNLSKIFGELLMLLEADYRDESITLSYSGELFTVPQNLYIIGMMNTADRSLAMIDYALRRRFSFFSMEPGFASDGFRAFQQEMASELFDRLLLHMKELNQAIADDPSLGKGFQIGHSYFCKPDKTIPVDEWLQSVVEYDIVPTLEEYWFDDENKAKDWAKKLREVFHDKGQNDSDS